MKSKEISLESIRIDGGTQMRAKIDDETVADYRQKMADGVEFPPAVLFFDGSDHWLADGFHRVLAAKAHGAKAIDAEVHTGTKRDAILWAVGANGAHGLPRTNADKRRAVDTLLADAEWSKWSDREIARHASVHPSTVGERRSSLSDSDSERSYKTKHGKPAKMKTDKIGRKSAAKPAKPADPPAPSATPSPAEAEQIDDAPTDNIPGGIAPKLGASAPIALPIQPAAAVVDAAGHAIPERVQPAFANTSAFDKSLGLLTQLSAAINPLLGDAKDKPPLPGGEWLSTHRHKVLADLKNIRSVLNATRPHAVCPYCQGVKPKCSACKGSGWLAREIYEQAPADLRATMKEQLKAG